MDDLLTKQQILTLIKNQDNRLTFIKPNSTSSSKVWSNFSYVYIDNREQNFVCCQICKEVLHHKSINGTSSMIKHRNMCEQVKKTINDNSTSIQQYFRPKTTQPISRKLKEKITAAVVEFVSLDNRAFELTAGDGFVHLVQTIFDAGQDLYKLHDVNVLKLLPDSRTISRNVDRLYMYRKSQLVKLCKEMKSYTIIVDFWTDTYTGKVYLFNTIADISFEKISIHYCGIGLSHLNNDLKLLVFILGCFPYDRENQTANQIRSFVDAKLMDFNLSLDNSKFIVSDNENKMKAAFKDECTRIGCSIHYVNKQLEHCFTSEIIDKVPVKCEIIQDMFSHIRKIVSHVRQAHKQSKLPRKLQSYSETRFSGAFYTMNVFLLMFDELVGVLNRNYMNNYESIDKDLLSYVCKFLESFDEAIRDFSSDTIPTIHKVLPFKQELLNNCKTHPDDHDGIQQMKIFLEKRLQEVWILNDIHYIATFLHPSFKNFDINPDLREQAINLVKKEILKRQSSISNTNDTVIIDTPADVSKDNHSLPTVKSLLSKCFDLQKTNSQLASTPYNELEEYITLNVHLKESDDILLFWLQHKTKFPVLFSIVQDYYAIPASNTLVERLFSSSKRMINDRRTSLGAEKINKLLFLQKNLKLLKQLQSESNKEHNATKIKRTMSEESFYTTSNVNQEKSLATVTNKKFKLIEQDSILFYDSDRENDDNDLF